MGVAVSQALSPPVVAAIAVVIFLARVVYLARRLKSASQAPTLHDLKALAAAKECVKLPGRALDEARAIGPHALAEARVVAATPAAPTYGMDKRYR